MMNLLVALLDEARPLIDLYQLKQVRFDPFPIYANDEIRLVLSKIGGLNAACAVTTLHHLFHTHPGEIWLNMGLAGHPQAEIGQGTLVSKVSHIDLKEVYYPSFVFQSKLPKFPLKTLNRPSSNYERNTLFDMEGFGFYQAASRYASSERIHLYKIISDNSSKNLDHFDRKTAQRIIQNNLSSIDPLIKTLKKLASPPLTSPHLETLLSRWHFTQTERLWLEKHLPVLHLHRPDFNFSTLKPLKAKEVLRHLKTQLKEIPL